MSKEVLGFVGLGIMGLPMARNLLNSGYQVVAYSRTKSSVLTLENEGASSAETPKEVAEKCEIIVTMVTDSPDVEEVVLGSNGIIEGIQKDSVLIDMSTISPSVTRSIESKLKERDAHMLDAPVSGGSWGAIEGTLSIMVGGDEVVFERCQPIFEAMGKNIVHTGPIGMGQITKLVNQILVVGTMNAVAEALVYAAAAGANLETTIEAVKGGAAGSWQLQNLGPRIIEGDFAPGFMVNLQQKDLRLVLEGARELDLSLPVTALISQFFTSLQASGEGTEGTQALVKVHERLAGITARSESGKM